MDVEDLDEYWRFVKESHRLENPATRRDLGRELHLFRLMGSRRVTDVEGPHPLCLVHHVFLGVDPCLIGGRIVFRDAVVVILRVCRRFGIPATGEQQRHQKYTEQNQNTFHENTSSFWFGSTRNRLNRSQYKNNKFHRYCQFKLKNSLVLVNFNLNLNKFYYFIFFLIKAGMSNSSSSSTLAAVGWSATFFRPKILVLSSSSSSTSLDSSSRVRLIKRVGL